MYRRSGSRSSSRRRSGSSRISGNLRRDRNPDSFNKRQTLQSYRPLDQSGYVEQQYNQDYHAPPADAYSPSYEQDYYPEYPEYYPQYPQEQGGYLQEQSQAPDYLSMLNNIVKVLTVLLLIYFGSKLKLQHIIFNPIGLLKKILKMILICLLFILFSYILRMIRSPNPAAYIIKKIIMKIVTGVVAAIVNVIPVLGQFVSLGLTLITFGEFVMFLIAPL
jgi:hypothetical protein